MKRLFSRGGFVAVLSAVVLATAGAPALAAPDPRIPNGAKNWCQGGVRPGHGGARYCLGKPFADGSFYAQSWSLTSAGIFAPGRWFDFASCSIWIEGSIQGSISERACGGRQFIDIR